VSKGPSRASRQASRWPGLTGSSPAQPPPPPPPPPPQQRRRAAALTRQVAQTRVDPASLHCTPFPSSRILYQWVLSDRLQFDSDQWFGDISAVCGWRSSEASCCGGISIKMATALPQSDIVKYLPKRPPVDIEFQDIVYTVPLPSSRGMFCLRACDFEEGMIFKHQQKLLSWSDMAFNFLRIHIRKKIPSYFWIVIIF